MSMLRSLTLGLSLAGTALAAERPAVRMLPAQPLDPVEALTARAASGGFDPYPTIPAPPRNDAARIRDMFDKSKAVDEPPSEPGNWSKFKKWVDERAKAAKKAVSGPPAEQPPPRVAGAPAAPQPASPQQPFKKLFESKKEKPPEPSKVNAANPAYRWYGWGTTTPGANSFAPSGEYPNGSAQWYNQTGATPGAFPVPTMNPYRAVPGTQPPTYVPPPVANAPTIPAPVLPTTTSRKTIAETPLVPQLPKPVSTPAFTPSAPAPPPAAKVEPMWKPASATEVIVPVIRGQEPSLDDSPMAKKIQAACKGVVTNVMIRETGPGQFTIAFIATTSTLAEIAVKAMSNIEELKPFTINFAGTLSR